MKKRKILFIARRYPSSKNPIAGIFIKEHARAVSLYGEVAVINAEFDSGENGLLRIYPSIEEGIRILRVRYHKSPIPKTTYIIYLLGIFAAFRALIKEGWIPDIIHAHVYSEGVPAVMLGKFYGIPVIISEHFSSFPRGMIKGFEKLKAIFAMNSANLIITVSKNLIEHLKLFGIKNRFKVIPNTFDTKVFYPIIKRKSRETIKFLLVASLVPVKGIPYLLEAVAILKGKRKDFILDIIGDGIYREKYEEYAYELGVRDEVKFYGLKTKKDIAQFMRNADFFVLPSIWENLPCVIIEAMACCLAVIASRVGGIPEILDEKTGILVPPKNKESLAEAISYMVDHVQDSSKERVAGYAKRKFSLGVIGRQFDNVFENYKKIEL